MERLVAVLSLAVWLLPAQGSPNVRIRLPERFRVLTQQRFDLRIEASGLRAADARLSLRWNAGTAVVDLPSPEVATDNDADPSDLDKSWTYRSLSLPSGGVWTLEAVVSDGGASGRDTARIGVQEFRLAEPRKSIILMIGDAMGTVYRDAARIVAQSANGRFREGFFDQNQQMDSLPVTGMVMTYALDQLVSDSANAATAWSTGNRTIAGGLSALADNNDFRFDSRDIAGTKQFALDNPRVETLWEYLKRIYGYRSGVVTTSDVTDATPAAAGAHSIVRDLGFEIARQFVDGGLASGAAFDVILGGGRDRFLARTADNSGDERNLVTELIAAGYAYVQNRTELKRIAAGPAAPAKLLGLFRTSHMNVAYDKLGLERPPNEPTPDFAGFPDQPFLSEMTEKALAVLSREGGPFILLVEGASIDKESHRNRGVGTIWDTIEFDHAVGVARRFATRRSSAAGGEADQRRVLVLVTADHDQSMHILGVADTQVPGAVLNTHHDMRYPHVEPLAGGLAHDSGQNPGEVAVFPDYADLNGDGFPENTNRYRLAVGFRTGQHTASSVPLTAEGPGALLFTGYYDQTDIFFKIARALSSDTTPLDRALDLRSNFEILSQNY
ncbi:MAG TPA: alkaline phosphatase [Terriglobia bacterium]|nr:alkaline phosphatase [Terriglobia bacterium]